ncbi:MAG: 9-O-acetylesterase [Bacteroidales bacterium]|nr:9-O-acetylesterase [Bacteroidales bacterium]
MILGCQKTKPPAKEILLTTLFTDNMVLQQKQDIPIWGTAQSGGEIVVTFNEQQKKTIVNDNGKWEIVLSPVPAGGSYKLVISGEETHTISNVMVGEVWVCSGQSNMEMAVRNGNNYEEEIANADFPNIRLFQVNHTTSYQPLDTINSNGWEECSPKTIPDFSAAAYYFGRKLFKELDVPIGLINSSFGGTPVESWISSKALKVIPEFREELEIMDSTLEQAQNQDNFQAELKLRAEIIKRGDIGYLKGKPNWNNPDLDVADWDTMDLPIKWEKAGYPDLDGIMWFRKEINIPASMIGTDLIMSLGPINDYDITWFNGVKVGSIIDANIPRDYIIPMSLVKPGKNVIVIKVEDVGYSGGIWGKANQMFITNNSGKKISIAGEWLYKIGFDRKVLGPKQHIPTVLNNAMIHPLIPFAIQGAIWYQGEANAGRAHQYQTLFPVMIKDWRSQWNQGDFSFLFVQLANFNELQTELKDDDWAELREAQLMTLSLPNTGMVVTIDIGNAKDIHPKNKQDVGKRLALNALAEVYGKDIPYSGPMYNSMEVEENKIRLKFNNTNAGLKIKESNQLKGFAIAGEDKKFVWAEAKIEDNEVVVWNTKIKNPVAVRYAWAANPICNLFNGADLPASPFRTDDWKGITYARK